MPALWHTQSAEDALKSLDSAAGGLNTQTAAERLEHYGKNLLPEPPRRRIWLRFLLQFHNILIYVLLVAAAITVFLDHPVDTAVILAVVLVNALIGFIQEGKAEKALEAIRHMLSLHASVLRDGVRHSLPAEELVPGDIVLLEAGDKVPADLRLIKVHNLQIQEAILTGESVPVEKNVKPVTEEAALGDRLCMAYSGTLVTAGQGRGIVVGTGAATEIGRISGMISDVQTLTTPLVRQMGIFARWLTVFILLIVGLLLAYGYFVAHHDFTDLFLVLVALAVAAIPEGLPAILTITLAIGVQTMAKRNAIVRRLPAIETLGSVSVIGTDKTGTLTRNEMMVASVATAEDFFTVEGVGLEPTGAILRNGEEISTQTPLLRYIARAAALCNEAALRQREGTWIVEGDPMEGALLTLAGKAGLDPEQEKTRWLRLDTLPFDARHRYMATLNRHETEDEACIFVKGAPERLLSMCTSQYGKAGETEKLDKDFWHKQAEEIAAKGQRVLAFGMLPVPADTENVQEKAIEGKLIFLGLTGLIDPPRPEAITAVAECHAAGIRVKMITGDHAATARAIAHQIGLQNPDRVLTGADLENMDDVALKEAVLDCDIFARTSPEHKLRLVTALQAHGLTVAMTGDGVNDAPALKRADAGIAMGQKGSEAAKEAAEIVLADDNFASIAAAVREGRTVYDNIKKVISWTLPTNAGESMVIVVALVFGLLLPMTPVQILWINMITAVTLGMALAFEPTEEATMRRPPRPRGQPILTTTLVWHILLVTLLFICGVLGMFTYALDRGYSVEMARSISMNTLVMMKMFHLFFIRNIHGTSLTWQAVRGTKVVWICMTIAALAQFAITYLPPFQAIFMTEAVPFFDGVLIFFIGVALFIILETEKQLRLSMMRMRWYRKREVE